MLLGIDVFIVPEPIFRLSHDLSREKHAIIVNGCQRRNTKRRNTNRFIHWFSSFMRTFFATFHLGGFMCVNFGRLSDEFSQRTLTLCIYTKIHIPYMYCTYVPYSSRLVMSDHGTDVISVGPTTRTEDRIEVSKSLTRSNSASVRSFHH